MAAVSQPLTTRSPFEADQHRFANGTVKRMPILSAAEPIRAGSDSGSGSGSGNGDPMDVSQPVTAPAANMGPPATSSPNTDRSPAELPPPLPPSHHHSPQAANNHENTVNGGAGTPSLGAQAAAQQPKIVQTAFIHKLYNMLEDQSIQHLISWSTTNDSFVMSPSTEFSKVLASYFKHTNISSFVRQLNMYGFHKVSDVFHTGSPDSPLWEFKHGAGNFKRGDLAGLREIKRRASRHALIHRDSFPSGPAATAKIPPQHPTALSLDQQPPPLPEPFDARLARLEMNQQELFLHIAHTEDAYTAISLKCRALLDGLTKVSHWGQELSTHLLTLIPDPENPIHRDVCALRQDMARHVDQLRGLDEPAPPLQYQPAPHESLFPNKPSFFPPPSSSSSTTMTTAAALEPPTMSPRQRAFDLDSRRPSLGPRPPSFRAPPHLSSPRRYGSIGGSGGGGGGGGGGSNARGAPLPHPLSQQLASPPPPPPNLARRHTSADIRAPIGWPSQQQTSPFASGQNSGSAWPSSPGVEGLGLGLRESLAAYELPPRHASPPPSLPIPPGMMTSTPSYGNAGNDSAWQIPGTAARGYGGRGLETPPGPPTRRSSMASNVHSLLNPADTAEREGEEDGVGALGNCGGEERKRKRVM